jgi:hypothetical protein
MTATEAVAECNQLLRRLEELAASQPNPNQLDLVPVTRRQCAAIATLIRIAMPEAIGLSQRDPQRRHR